MTTTIFAQQTETIDSELAALQQQIEQLQQQKQNLTQAQELADAGVDRPFAAGNLKTAVLALFKDNSDSNDEVRKYQVMLLTSSVTYKLKSYHSQQNAKRKI